MTNYTQAEMVAAAAEIDRKFPTGGGPRGMALSLLHTQCALTRSEATVASRDRQIEEARELLRFAKPNMPDTWARKRVAWFEACAEWLARNPAPTASEGTHEG